MIDATRTIVIAEAGVNHNGDAKLALELIDRAAEAGADYVKFQTFKATEVASAIAAKADYQKRHTLAEETQLDMLARLELSYESHHALVERCRARRVGFLSTAVETESLRFLAEVLRLDTIKVGSGELTNAPVLLAAARSGARLLLSTGTGSLAEVEEALGVIAFGLLREGEPARREDFTDALLEPAAWSALRERVTLLQCTTEYPAAIEDTNLRAIDTMRAAFGLPVGFSDHTEGNAMSIAAVARGAGVIEKHFTLDRTMSGPDHAASIEPAELAELVRGVRAVEAGLGNGIKQPSAAEVRNRAIVRKSVVLTCELPEGHVVRADDITVKRVGTGITAMEYWDCLGRRLTRPVNRDMPLMPGDLA